MYKGDLDESSRLASTKLVDSIVLARENRSSTYGSLSPAPVPPHSSITSSIVTLDDFDQFPVYARCSTCNRQVLTHTEHKIGTCSWMVFVLLLVFGLWCGCCLLPFVLSICKDVKHVCPDCKTELGVYKRYK